MIFTLSLPSVAQNQVQLQNTPLSSKHFQITLSSQLDPIAINQIHRWVIHLEDQNGNAVEDAGITLIGGMPEHDHGLPTAPRVTQYLGNGDYLIEGMKFHMAGRWQIDFVVTALGHRDSFSYELTL